MPIYLEKSLYYIKLAADNGLVEAMYQYGIRCRDGKDKNKVEAAQDINSAYFFLILPIFFNSAYFFLNLTIFF